MQNKKIIFRADGNTEIGLGHVIRSLSLAAMLKDTFTCTFATRFVNDYIIDEIKKIGIDFLQLPKSEDHFNYFLELLDGSEIVVLDNYFFDTNYQIAIKNKGCKLVCIDDLHKIHFVSDVVINHAPGAHESNYSKEEYTKLCLGLDYILLRPIFLRSAKIPRETRSVQTIFVCFGGSDPNNLTLKVAKQLQPIDLIKMANIVVGPAYQYTNELKSFISEANNGNKFRLYENLSEEEMVKAMDADLAIVPCSSILFECMALKLPVITGYFTDNQKEISDYFQHLDAGIVLGDLNQIQLSQSMIELIKNKPFSSINNLIDGRSGDRINDVFECLN